MKKIRKYSSFFLKGIAMGLADVIPGVSGGSIAFISGIYDRLISAIKSLDPRNPREIDYKFLIPLASGIATAFFTAANFIAAALNLFPIPTYAFFLGLIASSAFIIWRKIGSSYGIFISISGGFFIAFLLTGLHELQAVHSFPFIVGSGFVAISAMLLPGISGAFLLLLLGQYKFLLISLKNLFISPIIAFLIGAFAGLAIFSRIISCLLKRYHSLTYGFLTGLMLGALRLPLGKIVASLSVQSCALAILAASGGAGLIWLFELRLKVV